MERIALEKYMGKKVRITLFNNDTMIGTFRRLISPEKGHCKPLLYEIRMKDGTTKSFRRSDVKKCQEVKHNDKETSD